MSQLQRKSENISFLPPRTQTPEKRTRRRCATRTYFLSFWLQQLKKTQLFTWNRPGDIRFFLRHICAWLRCIESKESWESFFKSPSSIRKRSGWCLSTKHTSIYLNYFLKSAFFLFLHSLALFGTRWCAFGGAWVWSMSAGSRCREQNGCRRDSGLVPLFMSK